MNGEQIEGGLLFTQQGRRLNMTREQEQGRMPLACRLRHAHLRHVEQVACMRVISASHP